MGNNYTKQGHQNGPPLFTSGKAPVKPGGDYLAWTFPETLIPVINAKKQLNLLPILDFHHPFTSDPSNPLAHAKPKDDPYALPICESKDKVDVKPEQKIEPFHDFHVVYPTEEKKPVLEDLEKKTCRELTLCELWTKYQASLEQLQESYDSERHAEKFFEWLDCMTSHDRLEARVYDTVKRDLEMHLKKRLEWAHLRLGNPSYRTPLAKIAPVLPEADCDGNLPDPPVAVHRATQDRKARNSIVYEKVMVMAEARFGRFPALMNRRHSEEAKYILRKLVNEIHKKKKRLLEIGTEKRIPKYNSEDEDGEVDGSLGSDNDESESKKKSKKMKAKKPKPKPVKKDIKKSKPVRTKKDNVSEDDDGDEYEEVEEQEEIADDDQKVKPSKPTEKVRIPKKGLKKGEVDVTADTIDWTVRPIPAKRNWNEHYTKNEIDQLQKHSRKAYNLKLEETEELDIDAHDAAIDQGPALPAPVLINLLSEVVYNSRWRLTDLFQYGDKNRTWRLDPLKVRHMCTTLGLDYSQVSDTAITDFFVELDDMSGESITFMDLRRGVNKLIKEKRVRKRYCMAVEVARENPPPTPPPPPPPPPPTIVSPMDPKSLPATDKDQAKSQAEPFPEFETNTVKRFVQTQNRQPLPPPLEIGTDVCDEGGQACRWHAVFPEELILAWRIQQKLARLYQDSRWLEVKNAFRTYGPMRTVSHTVLDLDEPAPQTVKMTNVKSVLSQIDHRFDLKEDDTLEELANYPMPEQVQSHEGMHKRLSVSEGVPKSLENEPFPMITGTGAIRRPGRNAILSSGGGSQGGSDPNKYLLKPVNEKRSSILGLEQRDGRTEYDRFLRHRFRDMHNKVPIHPNPSQLLEILQIRAKKVLEETAKEEEDRLQAELDPTRRTEPTRGLVNDFTGILVSAHRGVQKAANVTNTTPLEFAEVCENAAERKLAIKARLLLSHRGLRSVQPPTSVMDSRSKAIICHAKRLKSSLEFVPPDIRACSLSSSKTGSTLSLVSAQTQEKSVTLPAMVAVQVPGRTAEQISKSSVPAVKPVKRRSKALTHREVLESTKGRVSLLLDCFLNAPRIHLMRGLTKLVKKQVRILEISKFQPLEIVERRLAQKNRMRLLSDNYYNSIRRNLWAQFRIVQGKLKRNHFDDLLSEERLRAVLLRREDFNHEIMLYDDAIALFKRVMEQEYGGKPPPSRGHKKWHRRFLALPTFFPLSDGPDLMKNMQAMEVADIV